MQRHGECVPGQERRERGAALLQQREPQHGEDRRRAAVHDRGAEAAHDPGAEAGIGDEDLIPDVFHDGEARPHRESENCGVDQEADPVDPDERKDDESLDELLDYGPREARIDRHVEPGDAEEPAVQGIADRRRSEAACDHRDDGAQRHELVAVEIDERREKAEHGGEPDQRMNEDGRREGEERHARKPT